MIRRLLASLLLWAKQLTCPTAICCGKICSFVTACIALRPVPAGPGFVKHQSDRLNSIRKHASKLRELLSADEADLGIIRSVWPITPEHPAHLLP